LPVKMVRLLLVVALLSFSASVVLADGIDPLVGTRSGGGSTPITLTNPNPTFDLTVVQDPGMVGAPGPGTICSISGDTCAVDPATDMLPVFQNDTGVTLTSITLFIQNQTSGGPQLIYQCNTAETSIFANCTTAIVAGGTDVTLSGGPGVPAFVFKPDDDGDDSSCQELGPTGPGCSDDFVGGEFAVDIEGILDGTDLPVGTAIQGTVVTSPEPGSALMLLFGMLAFGLAKVVRRAA
jgi:hypothetical protein